MDHKRSENVPHDRLTRLCEVASDAVEASAEYQEGDKLIIFIDDNEAGGLVLHGYEQDADAIAAMMGHLKALFEVNGLTLTVVPIGSDG